MVYQAHVWCLVPEICLTLLKTAIIHLYIYFKISVFSDIFFWRVTNRIVKRTTTRWLLELEQSFKAWLVFAAQRFLFLSYERGLVKVKKMLLFYHQRKCVFFFSQNSKHYNGCCRPSYARFPNEKKSHTILSYYCCDSINHEWVMEVFFDGFQIRNSMRKKK